MGIIIAGAAVALLVLIMLIRALRFKPMDTIQEQKADIELTGKNIEEHLSEAIKIKTISTPDPNKTDWKEFENYRDVITSYSIHYTKLYEK